MRFDLEVQDNQGRMQYGEDPVSHAEAQRTGSNYEGMTFGADAGEDSEVQFFSFHECWGYAINSSRRAENSRWGSYSRAQAEQHLVDVFEASVYRRLRIR